MKYKLETSKAFGAKRSLRAGIKRFTPLIVPERGYIAVAIAAMLVSSGATLIGPIIIGRAVDTYVRLKDWHGLLLASALLLAVYVAGVIASYTQIRTMGGVGRRVLFSVRNELFAKLQDLPLAFFTENKTGDLISRVNNDTDKLNQFVAQALMQFVGSLFLMTGVAVFVLSLNFRLGIAALLPAIGVFAVTKGTGAWVKRRNMRSMQTLGGLSAEVQESLHNFKVIVAFNRLDYFQRKFKSANDTNYNASVSAGFANNIFMPMYGFAHNLAMLLVVAYGIVLIGASQTTAGLLIGFLLYVNNFYGPMRQLATVWSSYQLALAALDRISEVLALESDMPVLPASATPESASALQFQNVHFHYPGGKEVLRDITLDLEKGSVYALVGPTGGGKTTTASLMARLYDATEGSIVLDGRDIRSIPPAERACRIGVIPQEPFLFTGTVRDNIVYGNEDYANCSTEELAGVLVKSGLSSLLTRFPEGLDTKVASSGESISLGQKQLIAFMRATLRSPELLILDEATANIDTVTEQLLEEILAKLPSRTTKVIIAHRLNTIDKVDQIFFVNSGAIALAGSMEHALEMLLHHKRAS
ncbi:MAG TPA: ABC transporter ATP-binding protein [Bryobacteraceae bacterium]|nr:ABC transporter ATP-binding protein [Bryobacteraceae bacterium]